MEAKEPILLGQTTLRRMVLFQKHHRVFIESIDILQIQEDNMARCVTGGDMSDNDNNANGQSSVSDAEQLDPEVPDIMDVTEGWVDSENIDSKILNVQGPKCMHPDDDIRTKPPIRSKGEFKEMYLDCSSGIGTFQNYRYHIEIDPKVKPIVYPPRKIALSLQPKCEKELDEMVKQGIIVPVDEPTDWMNFLVVRVKPNGSLRIFLDPKDLNKAIKREHYPVQTVDMVTNRLQGATLFFPFRWLVSILEC